MSRDNQSLIALVLNTLNCNQKELATRLGVSPSQITKWKAGEYMSDEMKGEIASLCGLNERDPDIIGLLGSVENHDKWLAFISHLAERADENGETGYVVELFNDEERNALVKLTIESLSSLGFNVPSVLPEAVDIDYDDEDLLEECQEHPLYARIQSAFSAIDDLSGFFDAYIEPIVFNNDDDELFDTGSQLQYKLVELAFIKTHNTKYQSCFAFEYCHQVKKDVRNYLKEIKLYAMKKSIPLGAELLNLIIKTHGELGVAAEREYLGFNDNRLHPDIYMNELLEGNRIIHQVLPLICKKMGITDIDLREFKDLTLSL